MSHLDRDRTYHLVRFVDGTESEAFVRALQRFLDSPRGEAFARNQRDTQIWAPKPLTEAPTELYLTDGALLATESGFAPVPAVEQVRGVEIGGAPVLIMKGAQLTEDAP
jgi:hypothetical protein